MRERYERDKSVTIAPFQLTETPCPPGEILYCIYDANRLSPPKDYDEEQCAAWIAEKVAGDDATRCEPPEAAETPESQLFAEQILYFPCNAPPFADAGGANSPYLISGSQEACGVPWYAFLPIRT
ncbi:MAG: hypothetical protein IJQ81_15445, partial [Oscillibacter sp.]|nr:hypothetical protein [Oscillibacter sp.]